MPHVPDKIQNRQKFRVFLGKIFVTKFTREFFRSSLVKNDRTFALYAINVEKKKKKKKLRDTRKERRRIKGKIGRFLYENWQLAAKLGSYGAWTIKDPGSFFPYFGYRGKIAKRILQK